MYYVIGYRKKVVSYNLKLALPHLTDDERKIIERKSFQHLCDMFLETMKTMSITPKQIEKRFVFKNIFVLFSNIMQQLNTNQTCSGFQRSIFQNTFKIVSKKFHLF
jgi:lauroyl/myristoyl acyltransferase